ncbi:MAG: M20/M25/M40 family metallo-hydrolase [Ignavibacteriae bacterium]|nr:M20/M25/M40 family metallo-hydrolase [Ignavibacteriota bacterium]
MNIKKIFIVLLFLSFSLFSQEAKVHHKLNVKIIPTSSQIKVLDEITINKTLLQNDIEFSLNENLDLKLISNNAKISLIEKSASLQDIGMDRDDAEFESTLKVNKYIISDFEKNTDLIFTVEYSGKIESPIKQSEENYQRGFSESPGIISDLGIYLAGSTYWIPTIKNEFVNFELTTELPKEWKTVSQGKRIEDKVENNFHIDIWDSPTPQEEIFLVAAKFNEYKYSTGSVDAFAFMRTPDESIANKYLETTAQYLEMYRQLIGPFPYTKFALVENFWETGYGMPSFTLLGEKIIRFPFILHSSYPHELLHNYWGNSVYVDFEKGNWCEGLTAYMADHLIKEQRGQAEEYRRSTLQKYSDYVKSNNDFPLNKFFSRHDAASEAIGYGKSLMVFHMLRNLVGDENFTKSFQVFNRNNKFKKASFDDIRLAFEETTGKDLKWFFTQWIEKTGAPKLNLENVKVEQFGNVFNLNFNLKQIQDGEYFKINIPVAIITQNGIEIENCELNDKEGKISLTLTSEPLKILVDPQFDVFRILDPNEIPAALSTAFGAEKTLMILPNENDKNLKTYQNFVIQWIKGNEEKFEVINENEIEKIPSDKAVWILGENKFQSIVNNSLMQFNSAIAKDSIKFESKSHSKNNNSFIASIKNPENINNAIVYLSIGNEKADSGLVRKLPHYGKYSCLTFEGNEPTNIDKGQWPVINSPLLKVLNQKVKSPEFKTKPRKALAELAPVFSSKRMMEHISFLASDEMKGRELGSTELENAANYISEKFKEFGLLPGSDDGSYFQTFEKAFHGKGNLQIKNVIGIIPGTNQNLKEAVVISAHYDHLGLGWPDVRKGNEGQIHNGADDNASGVSVLLELAEVLGKSLKPARTIIFIAFSGEEAGLVGSKYLVENYKKFPSDKIFANLNFDTVGRLHSKKIMILNGNTAREWKFIFMGTEYTTGIGSELITQELDASDQVAFIENGIPAVQFFSGPNEDYHKPSDKIEKIDADGLVKVITVARETLVYLADREDAMNFIGEKSNVKSLPDVSGETKNENEKIKEGRKVSTGTMPDFAYTGEGVKVAAISENSPGAKAGLFVGDIIKKVNGKDCKNLKEYSDLLKEHQPGDEVTLTIDRNGNLEEVKLILAER